MSTDDVKTTNSTDWGEVYHSLISCRLFLKEQKGCHKRTRGTGDFLFSDQHILKNKTRWKNVAIVEIDQKKAYNMVPQN